MGIFSDTSYDNNPFGPAFSSGAVSGIGLANSASSAQPLPANPPAAAPMPQSSSDQGGLMGFAQKIGDLRNAVLGRNPEADRQLQYEKMVMDYVQQQTQTGIDMFKQGVSLAGTNHEAANAIFSMPAVQAIVPGLRIDPAGSFNGALDKATRGFVMQMPGLSDATKKMVSELPDGTPISVDAEKKTVKVINDPLERERIKSAIIDQKLNTQLRGKEFALKQAQDQYNRFKDMQSQATDRKKFQLQLDQEHRRVVTAQEQMNRLQDLADSAKSMEAKTDSQLMDIARKAQSNIDAVDYSASNANQQIQTYEAVRDRAASLLSERYSKREAAAKGGGASTGSEGKTGTPSSKVQGIVEKLKAQLGTGGK